MKGLRLNFSRSGMSLTMGRRGASVNFGSRGTYLNSSIPGLGLYQRTKLSGSSSGYSRGGAYPEVHIGITEDGKPYIRDTNNTDITDEHVLLHVKRLQEYKDTIEKLNQEYANIINSETENLVEIHHHADPLLLETEVRAKLGELKLQRYSKKVYPEALPSPNEVKAELSREAQKKVFSLFFWTLKQRRQAYVEQEFPQRWQTAQTNYENLKRAFDENETQVEAQTNADYEAAYQKEKSAMEAFLAGHKEFTEGAITEFLRSITLPVPLNAAAVRVS